MEAQSTEAKSKSAAAIVGLVLGIIALVTSFLPIINNFSFILAALGLVFAVVGLAGVLRGKKAGKGMAVASAVVNVLAVIIVLATQSMYSAAIDDATKGVVSTSDGASANSTAPAAASEEPADKYAISDEELTGDTYTTKISGVFTNTSGEKLGYVSVSYNLFDADGNQIDTAYANTSNLDAGGTWKFEATALSGTDKVASYKLGDVTGF